MERVDSAIGRAFAFWCESEPLTLERLMGRVAWELRHVVPSDVVAVATVGRTKEGRFFVGDSFDTTSLPADTLLGLLTQSEGDRLRVWDHALDSVRFVNERFRASVLVRVSSSASKSPCDALALWCGSGVTVSQDTLERITAIAESFGIWLDVYAPAIAGVMGAERARGEMRGVISDLQGVLHDARAPLGILKYTLQGAREAVHEPGVVNEELAYLERLLGLGAPKESKHSARIVANVSQVLSRARRRFQGGDKIGAQISVSADYEAVSAKIPEVDLERVVTNVVSNAMRYAPQGRVHIESSRADDQVVIRIRDNGPGMCPSVRQGILQGRRVSGDGSGWGVGLSHSKNIIETAGGRFELRLPEGGGTEVVVTLPCELVPTRSEGALTISEGGVGSFAARTFDALCIIDDDIAHAESLKKILGTRGVEARAFSSLAEARSASVFEPSSVILCDVHMPDGGAERLLSMFADQRECPAIGVMSGDVSESLVYKLAACGARGFFAKPVALEEILDWIEIARNRAAQARLMPRRSASTQVS